ncbi:MAG: bifunctional riboflavin kinase/FAD synthetase [Helicobacter sp.]|uniref:bifunctional riboflavin kinase/FAD synthetase n=1 Tax=Helicobacter sp. TaxID=218 RepID=UPI0023C17952|nr:bifunctional riboflavin kinase/FAD synthetase [Helicobacter sp.]MDE5926535.1 bifunctional riboflavin kinase/FAD synthetase [Helicobacter sp.]MDE7175012.1 bifunctional riboflavin kinase/FAD synthetase [Helicobacter sp.]
MLSFLSLAKQPSLAHNITSLALGKFDGMHSAHQVLFEKLGDKGAILCIESNQGELLPQKYRAFYAKCPIFSLPLEYVRSKSDKEFVEFLLEILPNLKCLVVGYDFRFGKERHYYTFDLQKRFQGEVVVVEEVFYKKLSVHSGLIKELLINGNLKQANKLLGRPYEIRGGIVRGQGIGAKELVATINLQNDGFLLPKEGVYAGFVQLGAQSVESPKYPAVIFIGNRLSTDKSFAIEGHLLGMKLEVQQKEAGFFLVKYLRENKHFEHLSELKEQIGRDIERAYKALKCENRESQKNAESAGGTNEGFQSRIASSKGINNG